MTIPLVPATVATDDLSTIGASTVNSWRANMAKAIDGVGGSAGVPSTPATKIEIDGAGLELGGTLLYDAASVVVVMTAPIVNTTTNDVSYGYGVAGPGDICNAALDRCPNGSSLTTMSVYIDRADAGTLPSTRVKLSLLKVDVTTGTVTTIIAATVDPTAVLAAYEAHHAITFSSISEVIDTTKYVYFAKLDGEVGGVTSDVTMYAPRCTFLITSQDKAP